MQTASIAHEAKHNFSERENLFRDRYESEDDDNQVRAVAMHPKTAGKLAVEYGHLGWGPYDLGEIEEMRGYRVVKSWAVPIGEVRVVPRGRLEFYRDGPQIKAWPHVTPKGRAVRLTRILRSGERTFDEGVPEEVREKIQGVPIGQHPVMGTPNVHVELKDAANDKVYSLWARFPYYSPKGQPARKVVHLTHEMVSRRRLFNSLVDDFFAAPPPPPTPNFARTDLAKTDR